MTELIDMGGHGVYVWSAYALSFAALVGLGIWPLASLHATMRRLRRRGVEQEKT
ncbi:MAG: heme exporter protein CcmD [Gammaproteobacteria bacterium]|nr:heme exporter protein CcmD [Gammaproteobacteria bacterium]